MNIKEARRTLEAMSDSTLEAIIALLGTGVYAMGIFPETHADKGISGIDHENLSHRQSATIGEAVLSLYRTSTLHKEEETVACAVCKGSGKQTIKVQSLPPSPSDGDVPIDCVWCNGSGKMTVAEVEYHKAYNEMWCKCKISDVEWMESGKIIYHPYRKGEKVNGLPMGKDYYTHVRCGKVVQIG